ncbi:hypothetical protein AVEN_131558-1 [Araneus ventricosus]|uniref:Uncharacterized protein n=1 Tax=Araneus ventricosus TaxID=182803 RepID=A0A4Y2NQ34_ARAVE|nr:hypothetical protein AVEN_131558-1 [Araneus ventricosus]
MVPQQRNYKLQIVVDILSCSLSGLVPVLFFVCINVLNGVKYLTMSFNIERCLRHFHFLALLPKYAFDFNIKAVQLDSDMLKKELKQGNHDQSDYWI